VEVHHTMNELRSKGYNRGHICGVMKGERKYHKDIVKVCKIA